MFLNNLITLLQSPNLASKKWIFEQYDSQVMNDTIYTGGDAGIVRIHGTNKALAITTDCTPRYVEADAFEGAKQAVAETYRNICAVGAKPLAITNCLNFGNPQKPEIMGQIVRSIKGINAACVALDYPVVSGNVSLYNETDGKAIQPTPAIGGVGLLKNLDKRCDLKFKRLNDEIFIIGKTFGHINCSIFEQEILKVTDLRNPPIVNLEDEKKHGEFIRDLIEANQINACHDISDGGLLVTLFEMCFGELGCEIDIAELRAFNNCEENNLFFGEDQSRYVVALDPSLINDFKKKAEKKNIAVFKIGKVIKDQIKIGEETASIKKLQTINQQFLAQKFS
ncbi:MAG: AIR synthase related protein [Rickettsiales bacterium]|nr:AIR synthase related protein [Rickettsiales bacterium]